MYERFFGLNERPFDLTADPRFLHLTASHREALYTLRYGISGAKGISMLIGEAGTGKTTLLYAALEDEAETGRRIACIKNPSLTRSEFLESLTNAFRLSRSAAMSKSQLLLEVERQLLQCRDAGGVAALVIDEAQTLSNRLLEEVRLLANLETHSEKLLSLVLVGQPELAKRLNDPSLRQLKQRVALRATLQPLGLHETAGYVSSRILTAGGNGGATFTREAVIAVHRWSGGIPRTISVICDNALIIAFANDQKPVDEAAVIEACADLELTQTGAAPKVDLSRESGASKTEHGSTDREEPDGTEQVGGVPRWRGFTSFR